jgi:kinesin family member C1
VKKTIRETNINKLQSMVGNIRVMCRIRPKLRGEEDEPAVDFGEMVPSDFSHHWGGFRIREKSKGVTGDIRTNIRKVDLERIYGPEASNSDIFSDVQDLIECSMRGDPVCIFFYGASGSGKTHTMGGAGGTPGLINQTMEMIFQKAERKKHRYAYKFELSIVEIYLDNIMDLTTGGPKDKISADQAEWVELDTVETAQAVAAAAVQAQAVAKTTANANSSRSHMIFSLRVARKELTGDQKETVGLLYLTDLAGSERVAAVTNTALGRQEGTAINKSLSDLTTMMDSLGKGSPLAPTSALGR